MSETDFHIVHIPTQYREAYNLLQDQFYQTIELINATTDTEVRSVLYRALGATSDVLDDLDSGKY